MELRHLRYFRTVAEEGHISRAAERLDIQQPPLSLQIKALEKELDVQLFYRRSRGVELTSAGESFFADTCAILDAVDGAVERSRRVARGTEGSLSVGFTSSVIYHPATQAAIRSFRIEFPGVTLTLEEEGSKELIDDIAANKLDAALVRSTNTQIEGIQIIKLMEEPFVLAIPPGNILERDLDVPVTLDMLADQPLILYRRISGTGPYDRIVAACRAAGITPRIVQEAPRVGAALNLVAAGIGISFVPDSLRVSHAVGVHYRPIHSTAGLNAPIMLACRKSEQSQAIQNFIAVVRAAMRENSISSFDSQPD